MARAPPRCCRAGLSSASSQQLSLVVSRRPGEPPDHTQTSTGTGARRHYHRAIDRTRARPLINLNLNGKRAANRDSDSDQCGPTLTLLRAAIAAQCTHILIRCGPTQAPRSPPKAQSARNRRTHSLSNSTQVMVSSTQHPHEARERMD